VCVAEQSIYQSDPWLGCGLDLAASYLRRDHCNPVAAWTNAIRVSPVVEARQAGRATPYYMRRLVGHAVRHAARELTADFSGVCRYASTGAEDAIVESLLLTIIRVRIPKTISRTRADRLESALEAGNISINANEGKRVGPDDGRFQCVPRSGCSEGQVTRWMSFDPLNSSAASNTPSRQCVAPPRPHRVPGRFVSRIHLSLPAQFQDSPSFAGIDGLSYPASVSDLADQN